MPAASDAPPPAEPIVFGGCFGWLHRPVEHAATGRGVVLCGPFGHEAVGTGRGWRILAETLAAAGLPTVRFDYPGTGDSAGDEAPERLDAWIASVQLAADLLRERAGVAEVALCGFRLGADIAAAAAARRPRGTAALALLAPIGSGRHWRRQLLLDASSGAADPEWLECNGFRLHRSDVDAAAQALDLGAALLAAGAPRVLAMGPARLPGAEARARLLATGVALENRDFDGLGAFLREAHLSVVPRAAFAGVARWLRDGAPPAAAAPTRQQAQRSPVLALASGGTEHLVRFGAGSGLVGVLCEPPPDRAARAAPAVLLPNTGANGRTGNGRMAVRLARRLAAAGVASLRMDATGIGDGRDVAGDGDEPPDTYHPQLTQDVIAALDLLESAGHDSAMVAGLCSGAHAAFQAAVVDARVRGLVLVNLPAFDRAAGGAPALDGGPPPGERPALRRPRMLLRRIAAEADRIGASTVGVEFGLDRAGRWMRGLLARRVAVVLAYSAGDRGLRELRAHFGRCGRRLAGSGPVRCVVLDGADHSLLPRGMQEQFIALVEAQALGLASGGVEAVGSAAPPPSAARHGSAAIAATITAAVGALLRRPASPHRHAG